MRMGSRSVVLGVSLAAAVAAGLGEGCSGKTSGGAGESGASCSADDECASSACVARRCEAVADGGGTGGSPGAGGSVAVGGGPGPGGKVGSGGSIAAAAGGAAGDPGLPPAADASTGSDAGLDVTGACFAVPPAVCSWGQVAAKEPSLGWTVGSVMPTSGGDDLALEIFHDRPDGQ